MARNTINDFSDDPASNSDIGGVPILGSSPARNIDDAMRSTVAIIAKAVDGTTPVNDTWKFRNVADTSKTARLDLSGMTDGTNRDLDVEALYQLAENEQALIDLLTPPVVPSVIAFNYLSGFTTSNNATDATNDIDISGGFCADSTNLNYMGNTSALTKRLDGSWVVGTNQGGLDTGSIADTTYHVYVIKRLDTNVVDVIFSASASAPTLPTNYTIFRRVASFVRVSGAIVAFSQFGDEFLLSAPFLDYDGNQPTTSSLLPMRIPTGVKMQAMLRVRGTNASNAWAILISSPDVPAVAPQTVTAPLADIGNTSGLIDRATLRVRTDTSARVRAQANNTGTDLQISAYGWIDARGKN